MADNPAWYYLRNGQQIGPVDIAQVRAALQGGEISAADLVWREGLADWVAASALPELGMAQAAYAAPPVGLQPSPAYIAYAAPVGYAGFWKRLAAMILDWLILMVPNTVVNLIIYSAAGRGLDGEIATQVYSAVATWLYYALMESSSVQGTVGKLALGIKVTDLNGARISFGRATGRHFAKIISSVILLIGFFMAAFTERKQGLHDIIAGCLVMNRTQR